jgi:hypothetical protein
MSGIIVPVAPTAGRDVLSLVPVARKVTLDFSYLLLGTASSPVSLLREPFDATDYPYMGGIVRVHEINIGRPVSAIVVQLTDDGYSDEDDIYYPPQNAQLGGYVELDQSIVAPCVRHIGYRSLGQYTNILVYGQPGIGSGPLSVTLSVDLYLRNGDVTSVPPQGSRASMSGVTGYSGPGTLVRR